MNSWTFHCQIPIAIRKKDYKQASKLAEYYKSIFGEDFYIELMSEALSIIREDIIIELLKSNAKIDELDNNSDDVYAYLKSNECDNPDEVNNIKKILKNYK